MNRYHLAVALSAAMVAAGGAEGPQPVFRAAFDGTDADIAWQGDLTLTDPDAAGSRRLRVASDDPATGVSLRATLPAEALAGQLVTLHATVEARGVSQPPKSWNGIKVMLILENADGGKKHPQIPLPVGTYPAEPFTHALRVPADIVKATLVVGLEQVSGEAFFDDIRILAGRPERRGKVADKPFTGHDLPRLRGVMHGPRFNEENLRVLGEEWGANQVRWQLNWVPMKEAETWARDPDAYRKWLEGALDDTEKAMDACAKYGLLALVDLHCPPGGRVEGGVCPLFSEQRYIDLFLESWETIARRLKDKPCVYAYDLLNEPVEPARGAIISWRDLASQAIRRIRAVDPDKPVVFEPGPWGGPAGFDMLQPPDEDRVIYSFHMYLPHNFTHQGVHGSPVGVNYPGTIDGEYWDRDRLRQAMLPAEEFARDFNVHMYVGEFSAIRWAPDGSAFRYLRDVISLFEERGWDWSYHAYREWPGWSVEHGPDPDDGQPTREPTPRKQLLLEWFAKNRKPTLP